MINAGLTNAEVQCHFGGNIGGSLLNKLGSISQDDVVILELLNLGASSGEIRVVDKDLNLIGKIENY